MKLVRKDLEKDNAGQVTLIPEDPEDMWHTYNLLQVGDSLRASTIRKVQTESATGSVGSNRIRTTLTLCVEAIDFDSQACQLRVKGTNIQENEYVKMGAYHTIELEPNRQFTLAKKQWDSVVLERIEQACDPAWSADVAAVVMQEGLAHVCLVTASMTLTRAKVEVNIPRKRKGNCSQHDRALERFYEQVMQAIQRHINFEVVKCVLVASPGFVREQFCDFMFQQAIKTDNKLLLENRSKFLQVHSSSGHKYALKEALCDPAVTSRLSDTKAAGEVKALDDFYKMLQHEPDRAFYGLKHVEKANEAMAIDTLLISDELFRHQDVVTRARYVRLVDSVRENMGTVRIFSSLHVSGEQLGQLTGIAAILRFPVAELSDTEALFHLIGSSNVDVKNAMTFSGPLEDMFGYTVQQYENEEGKWILIGSPLVGQPEKRTGDVYKCPVGRDTQSPCIKLNLPASTSVPNVVEVKENMTLGTTLVTNPKGGFLACGPLYAYKCGRLHYTTGVCSNVSSTFETIEAIAPSVQECKNQLDIIIVLDGSNSIYPWESVTDFLNSLLRNMDIGPQQTQVGIVQYGQTVVHEFFLNTYSTTEDVMAAATRIRQRGGTQTMTALGIDTARKEAFTEDNGARRGVQKVMVIVTDGESHDNYRLKEVIDDCEDENIQRFAIAILGSYSRGNLSTEKFVEEIKSIASKPTEKHFFNVSDELALITIVEALGERIFALEATTDQQAASFEMEMSQAGFSAHYSQDWIMLGAVGAYDWNGTVIMVKDSGIFMPTNDTFRDRRSEKNEPLAAYLGYTVNSAMTRGGVLYIAGQPRYNHTGQVIIYKMEGKEVQVLQRLNGEQIGSYFGGVITTIDINRDSYTDLLLVGAPMYMGTEKEEQGKVYVYGLNKTKFDYQMSLEPIKQTCCSAIKQDTCKVLKNEPCGARFGTAIAAVKDLNLDGYNDIVIGSPLEDDHRGAVYIYHGRGNTISKKYSQRIASGGDGEKVKFFGQSVHGEMDLNDDGLIDVTIGGLGGAALFWSRDVAEVNVSMQFTPKSINIQQQNCQINIRKTICISSTICFKTRLKSKEDTLESNLQYWITLDSQRQISRSLFMESHERKMQKNMTVKGSECIKHNFYMLDKPDFQDSVKVLLEFNFSDPESGPVLDSNLPNSVSEYIPFTKDCGAKNKCISDLVLKVKASIAGDSSSPFIVKTRNDKFTIQLSVQNKKDSAYNTRVLVQYSPNIIFSGIEDIQKDSCESNHNITCKVGYPFLKPAEEISFKISFQFNASYLLENATIHVYATSDSEEPPETLSDNRGHVTIPVKYEVGLIFVSVFKEHHIIISPNDTVPSAINTTEQIGDEVTLHYRIEKGEHFPVPNLTLKILFPNITAAKNTLLYLTALSHSQNAICQSSYPVDPFKISTGKPFVLTKIREPTKDTIMDCDTYSCASINCALVPSDVYQVNVSLRVWKPTIIKASIHSLTLVVKALLRSENSSLILRNDHQKLETMIKISKEFPPGTVPLWVILLSIFAGLLILALLIFALWKTLCLWCKYCHKWALFSDLNISSYFCRKAGFFKRPLKKKMQK